MTFTSYDMGFKGNFLSIWWKFSNKLGKLVKFPLEEKKKFHNFPNFLCIKNNRICPKIWMMSLCVSFLWMVDNVTMWTYWAILEEDGVMSLQVIHFASACFAIIRLDIFAPSTLVSNGTYFQTCKQWQHC